MALDSDQKQFIRKKVKELDSIEKVKQLYYKDCAVDKYAVKFAKRFLEGLLEGEKKND